MSPHPPSTLTDSIPARENPRPTKSLIFFQATIRRRIVVLSEAKDLSTRTPTILRIFFQVPYTLNSFFSHSSENCRGVPTFFPFWNSPVSHRSPLATFFCFQHLTTMAICNPFLFMTLQQYRGCVGVEGAWE